MKVIHLQSIKRVNCTFNFCKKEAKITVMKLLTIAGMGIVIAAKAIALMALKTTNKILILAL